MYQFLIPLTLPSKCAISEGHSLEKIFNFLVVSIALWNPTPGEVNPGSREWFQMKAKGYILKLNSQSTTYGGGYRACRPFKSEIWAKNNITKSTLRPPTAQYSHFHVSR
jgi:hypothetical protein